MSDPVEEQPNEVCSDVPNPIDILSKGLGDHGVSVVFKQKLPDGTLEDTKESHLSLLKTRTNVATMAQALQNLTQEEKSEWALLTKNQGNEFFAEQRYAEALEKYVECLTASNFDGEPNSTSATHSSSDESAQTSDESNTISVSNVDILVVPVLCNMAACCIQLQAWSKAALFCEQAIKLRPQCSKALLRKGIALFNLGEYKHSISALQDAIDNSDEYNSSNKSSNSDASTNANSINNVMYLKLEDIERAKIYLGKATSKHMFQKRAEALHRKKLQKVFDPKKEASESTSASIDNSTDHDSSAESVSSASETIASTNAPASEVVASSFYSRLLTAVRGVYLYYFGNSAE